MINFLLAIAALIFSCCGFSSSDDERFTSLGVKRRAALNITHELQAAFLRCNKATDILIDDVKTFIIANLNTAGLNADDPSYYYYYAIATNRRTPSLAEKDKVWLDQYLKILRPLATDLYKKFLFKPISAPLDFSSFIIEQAQAIVPPRPRFDHWRTSDH